MNLIEQGLQLQAASIGKHATGTRADVPEPRDQPIGTVIAALHDLIGDMDRFEMQLVGFGREEYIEPSLEIHGEWMRAEDVEGLLKKLEKALG